MPNATADLSILTLVANASLVVKLVLAVESLCGQLDRDFPQVLLCETFDPAG